MGEADGGRAAVPRAGQGGKGLLRSYLAKTTGLSRAQVTRLIGQYLATGKVEEKRIQQATISEPVHGGTSSCWPK
jgi:hypothetical protein